MVFLYILSPHFWHGRNRIGIYQLGVTIGTRNSCLTLIVSQGFKEGEGVWWFSCESQESSIQDPDRKICSEMSQEEKEELLGDKYYLFLDKL